MEKLPSLLACSCSRHCDLQEKLNQRGCKTEVLGCKLFCSDCVDDHSCVLYQWAMRWQNSFPAVSLISTTFFFPFLFPLFPISGLIYLSKCYQEAHLCESGIGHHNLLISLIGKAQAPSLTSSVFSYYLTTFQNYLWIYANLNIADHFHTSRANVCFQVIFVYHEVV